MAQIFPIDFEEKLTMAQDDYILFSDSEDGNKIKKAQYKNLKWEKGDPWTPWQDWEDGAAATITVGSVSTLPAWSSATVTNSWTTSAAVLNFGIPEWATGTPWADWQDWADGAAATITVGTTTTLSPWSSATVTNVGTSTAAVFDFGIPQGTPWTWSWDVLWPASSTDDHIVTFDGTTWKLIQDSWISVSALNTQTFTLSSTSDLTNAQAALDWYLAGKNPIINYNGKVWLFYQKSSESIVFEQPDKTYTDWNSNTGVMINRLVCNISSGNIYSINVVSTASQTWYYLRTNKNYTTPYTPTYDWSPATKKYVDDKKSTISVTLTSAWWSSSTQTVTATGVTASNTVIVSPAPSSIADYTAWWVYCSAQGTNSLTFTCDTEPSNDITVNVVILS